MKDTCSALLLVSGLMGLVLGQDGFASQSITHSCDQEVCRVVVGPEKAPGACVKREFEFRDSKAISPFFSLAVASRFGKGDCDNAHFLNLANGVSADTALGLLGQIAKGIEDKTSVSWVFANDELEAQFFECNPELVEISVDSDYGRNVQAFFGEYEACPSGKRFLSRMMLKDGRLAIKLAERSEKS